MKDLVLIKLGGSIITDKSKPLTLREDILKQLAKEIAGCYQKYTDLAWVIGNGAGSFGHFMVHQTNYLEKPDDPDRINAVHQSVCELNNAVVEALQNAGVPSQSVPPLHHFSATEQGLGVASNSLLEAINHVVVPVVFGDIVLTESGSRIAPTEEVLDAVARYAQKHGYNVRAVIYVTSVDGVLDKHNRVIPILTQNHSHDSIRQAGDYDVTGGMAQKVAAGFRALDYTQNVYIINGLKKGALTKALALQAVGTKLKAETRVA